jgi:hypothetical protein
MKKIIITVLVVFALVLSGVTIVPMVLSGGSCDYTNFAWGAVHRECSCLGIKVDNSCRDFSGQPCPDAGGGKACVGIVTERRCYELDGYRDGEYKWTQVSCSQKQTSSN